jgi:dTDP-4-dehydrorhamnose reductase
MADNVNIIMAVTLASLASKLRAKFVQLSCADVYDGSDGNYSEEDNDFTMQDDFGKQKVAAESYIRTQTLESTILRAGRVLGLGHPYRPSEFDRLRSALQEKQTIYASQKQTHSYLSVRSFCHAISLLLAGEFPNRHRIFHLGGAVASEFELYSSWAKLVVGEGNLVKPQQEDSKRNLSVQCKHFMSTFPEWKPETKAELFLNLLEDLSPGAGTKKWRKTLQTP